MLDDSRLEKRETELDLFRRAKTGNFTAFQEIVEQLQPRVFGLMLRILHQTQDAEDATQQTFVH